MSEDIAIIGIGQTAFGRHEGRSGLLLGADAVRLALADAGIGWGDVQAAFGGSQDAGNADALVEQLGLSGLRFTNIANGCATGGSALSCARAAILAGDADVAVAVGFDKHPRGAFNPLPAQWGRPDWYGECGLMLTTQFFALRTRRYMHDHGISEEALSIVAERAYRNGAANPLAWRRTAVTREEVATSRPVNAPLRSLMFCTPGEGGAALVLCRAGIARRYTSKSVLLKAVAVRSRPFGSFEVFSPSLPAAVGRTPSELASAAAYERAGIGPDEIDVIQIQDTDSGSEIMHMAENGFCAHGEQEKLLREGQTAIGGARPMNTDGGCIANGEPVGASGLRQIYEVCLQLRGEAGARQVPGRAATGYTHVYGAPGISAVSILQR